MVIVAYRKQGSPHFGGRALGKFRHQPDRVLIIIIVVGVALGVGAAAVVVVTTVVVLTRSASAATPAVENRPLYQS